jgi:hypothetical protein
MYFRGLFKTKHALELMMMMIQVTRLT